MINKVLLVIIILIGAVFLGCDGDGLPDNTARQAKQTVHKWVESPPVDVVLKGDTQTRTRPKGEPDRIDYPPPGGTNPRDTPPPIIFGEEIELTEAKKIILLIAGQSVVDRMLADYGPKGGPGDWRVVSMDSAKLPAKNTYFGKVSADTYMKQAWSSLIQTYASDPFVKKEWKLIAMVATTKSVVKQMLTAIKDQLDPDIIVFQYFGHGDNENYDFVTPSNPSTKVDPYLSLCPYTSQMIQKKNPVTKKWHKGYKEFKPNRGRNTPGFDARYYIRDLGQDLVDLYINQGKQVILVVDGCTLGPALNLASSGVKVVVSQKETDGETVLAKWSIGFAKGVTPESFEMWGGPMRTALDAGNQEVAGNKPVQIGDMRP